MGKDDGWIKKKSKLYKNAEGVGYSCRVLFIFKSYLELEKKKSKKHKNISWDALG